MSCTVKSGPNYGAYLVKADNGLSVIMPDTYYFEKIRWYIATVSHISHTKLGRLSEAYTKAGREDIMPPQQYIPCIKAIYQMTDFDPARRVYIDKPAGDWIYDEACKCLEKTTGEGRIDLGDGFIVPNSSEQTKINTLVFSSNYSLYSAIQSVCPDITPPLESLACIEKALRGTNWQYYDVYRACRTDYVAAQASIPSTSPPPEKKNNTILWLVGGIIVFFILSR